MITANNSNKMVTETGQDQGAKPLKRESNVAFPLEMDSPEESSSGKKRRRSRKGLEKQYACEEADCGKRFTRLEHLYRHQLNHRPKEIFKCTWEGCDKTFVREDLRQRHLERHEKRQTGSGNPARRQRRDSRRDEEEAADSSPMALSPESSINGNVATNGGSNGTIGSTKLPMNPLLFDESSSFLDSNRSSALNNRSTQAMTTTTAQILTTTTTTNANTTITTSAAPAAFTNNYSNNSDTATRNFSIDRPVSDMRTTSSLVPEEQDTNASDLISWLFSDAMLSNAKDPILSPSLYSFDSPMSLHSLLSPPSTQEEITMSDWKRRELFSVFPFVESHEAATLSSFQRYIAKFWAYIHPQYPILHKPSFQADKCPAGLLWAILLLGAAIDKQHDFTIKVAEPLRWYLFGSPDFHPPAKLWVIQALVMLELYEKTMSNRREHERAHIHHATTLQLLRRGSVLRGMESPREVDPWKRWIETEAAKRVALMAFVLDVFDATMFGHSMVMSVHEIRLSLPCSESIWAEFPSEKGIPRIQSTPFLVALKKLLNKSHVETGPFGRRVLLGGLLCISHQMQERDLQVSSLGWGQFKDTWRDILGPAYNFWKTDYENSMCDDVPVGGEASNYSYTMELQGCTSSFYHLAHMSMMITFLDAQVYAGCPSVLNQPVRQLDHENSVRKVNEWAMSQYGRHAYWHAIQFLKEMYLTETNKSSSSLYLAKCDCPPPPKTKLGEALDNDRGNGSSGSSANNNSNNSKDNHHHSHHHHHHHHHGSNVPLDDMIKVQYDAFNDPVGKRPNAVYLCALMVWAFGYCLDGPETTILAETVSSIEQELRVAAVRNNGIDSELPQSGNGGSSNDRVLIEPEDAITAIENETSDIQPVEDGYEFLHRVSQYSPNELGSVRNKNQSVGLLRMVVQSLKYHHTELVQEGRRLLVHCIDRSLGRNKIRCEYMFGPKTKGGMGAADS